MFVGWRFGVFRLTLNEHCILFQKFTRTLASRFQNILPGGLCCGGHKGWSCIGHIMRHSCGTPYIDILQCFCQRIHHCGLLENIHGTTRALFAPFAIQDLGIFGTHQYQVIKAHGFDGSGSCTNIAWMARFNEYETCGQGICKQK